MAESAAAALLVKAAGTATLKGALIKVGVYAALPAANKSRPKLGQTDSVNKN